MKSRKQPQAHVCPKLKNTKAKGEWAEMVFMAKATALGFTVCRPYGDNQPFDFLIFKPGSNGWRIQVKSSWSRNVFGFYCFTSRGNRRRRYGPKDVDFIIGYAVPEDTWYVVPLSSVSNHMCVYVAPQLKRSRGRFEKYREAWYLLDGAVPGCGIELQACADPKCLTTEDTEDAEGVASG